MSMNTEEATIANGTKAAGEEETVAANSIMIEIRVPENSEVGDPFA